MDGGRRVRSNVIKESTNDRRLERRRYESAGFCDKNKDPLGRNLYDAMALHAATFDATKELFPDLGSKPRPNVTVRAGTKRRGVFQ